MKLFQRSKNDDAPAEEANAAADAGESTSTDSAERKQKADAEEFAQAIDRSVKEIGEKIVRLTSSVESVSQEKADFEEKMARMEERMRKLTSLTEVMSAKYNPFIGDEPPPETQVLPEAALPSPLNTHPHHARPPPPPAPLTRSRHPGPEMPAEFEEAVEFEGDAFDEEPFMPDLDDDRTQAPAPPATRAYLESVPRSFASSYMLLNWSELLIRRAGREGMGELLAYYEQLGWIGNEVKAELLSYAQGILLEDEDVEAFEWREWRAEVDLHARSLLFIERLKGTELTPTLLRRLENEVAWIARSGSLHGTEPTKAEARPRTNTAKTAPEKAAKNARNDAPKKSAPKKTAGRVTGKKRGTTKGRKA